MDNGCFVPGARTGRFGGVNVLEDLADMSAATGSVGRAVGRSTDADWHSMRREAETRSSSEWVGGGGGWQAAVVQIRIEGLRGARVRRSTRREAGNKLVDGLSLRRVVTRRASTRRRR